MNNGLPEIIGSDEPTYYSQQQRRSGGPRAVLLGGFLCCICLFLLLLGGVGIWLTLAPQTPPPTPTPTPAPTPLPSECTGFLDIPETQQPIDEGCSADTAGFCSAPGFCTCAAFQPGSTRLTPLLVQGVVPDAACSVSDPQQLCRCDSIGISTTCRRIVEDQLVAFQCQQPQACPQFADLPPEAQPIAIDCGGINDFLSADANGICQQVENGELACFATGQTAGQNQGDAPALRRCQIGEGFCFSVAGPCRCLSTICTRDIDGAPVQFLCQDESIVNAQQ